MVLLTLLVSGCTGNPKISFDAEKWRSDPNGCRMERYQMYQEIMDDHDILVGLNNRQIIQILGKPERNELYQRNQKFFIYSITPSERCNSEYNGEDVYLFIRFNAVGLSQEIFLSGEASFRDQ